MHCTRIILLSLFIYAAPGKAHCSEAAAEPEKPVTTKTQLAPPAEKPSTLDTIFSKPLTRNLIFATLGLEVTLLFGSDTGRHILKSYCSPVKALGTICREYCSNFIVNLIHEIGHATACKLSTGKSTKVIFGSHNTDGKALFSVGNVSINGLHPASGATILPPLLHEQCQEKRKQLFANTEFIKKLTQNASALLNPGEEPSPERINQVVAEALRKDDEFQSAISDSRKTAFIYAAGPLAGLGANQLRKLIMSKNMNLDHIDALQLVNLLIPNRYSADLISDGGMIAKRCLGASEGFIEFFSSIDQIIDFCVEVGVLLSTTPRARLHELNVADIVGFALINKSFRGFFRIDP